MWNSPRSPEHLARKYLPMFLKLANRDSEYTLGCTTEAYALMRHYTGDDALTSAAAYNVAFAALAVTEFGFNDGSASMFPWMPDPNDDTRALALTMDQDGDKKALTFQVVPKRLFAKVQA